VRVVLVAVGGEHETVLGLVAEGIAFRCIGLSDCEVVVEYSVF